MDVIRFKKENYVNAKNVSKDAFAINAKNYIGICRLITHMDARIVCVIGMEPLLV